MNEIEREALSKILVALFLESPRRKALLSQQNSTTQTQKKTSTTNKPARKNQQGEKHNGCE